MKYIQLFSLSFFFLSITIQTMEPPATATPANLEREETVVLDPIPGVTKRTRLGYQPRSLLELACTKANQTLSSQINNPISENEAHLLCKKWIKKSLNLPLEIKTKLFRNLFRDSKITSAETELRKKKLCNRLLQLIPTLKNNSNTHQINSMQESLLTAMTTHAQSFFSDIQIFQAAFFIKDLCLYACKHNINLDLSDADIGVVQQAFKINLRKEQYAFAKYLIEHNANLKSSEHFKGIWYYAIESHDKEFMKYLSDRKIPFDY